MSNKITPKQKEEDKKSMEKLLRLPNNESLHRNITVAYLKKCSKLFDEQQKNAPPLVVDADLWYSLNRDLNIIADFLAHEED